MIDALIIIQDFLEYKKGQVITGDANIADVLESSFRRFVVKTRVTDPS